MGNSCNIAISLIDRGLANKRRKLLLTPGYINHHASPNSRADTSIPVCRSLGRLPRRSELLLHPISFFNSHRRSTALIQCSPKERGHALFTIKRWRRSRSRCCGLPDRKRSFASFHVLDDFVRRHLVTLLFGEVCMGQHSSQACLYCPDSGRNADSLAKGPAVKSTRRANNRFFSSSFRGFFQRG